MGNKFHQNEYLLFLRIHVSFITSNTTEAEKRTCKNDIRIDFSLTILKFSYNFVILIDIYDKHLIIKPWIVCREKKFSDEINKMVKPLEVLMKKSDF